MIYSVLVYPRFSERVIKRTTVVHADQRRGGAAQYEVSTCVFCGGLVTDPWEVDGWLTDHASDCTMLSDVVHGRVPLEWALAQAGVS